MPRVPRPDEMPRAALEPANQPAQINMRVAESIGQSGRQMGNAIAAIGSAFGEVAGKIGQANDATNYDNAKLEWLKGDQTIQDDTRSNAGEDGAQWQSVPQRYADLNKSIDERFPIGNPAQKRQLDFWREQNTFNRGIGAAREYQGAQRNQFLKGFDQDVSGLEQRIADGQVDPTMFGQHYDALSGKLGSMNRTVISQAEAEAKTRELQSRLVGATDRYLATKDPAERDRFWGQVRGGRFEIDQNAGKPGGAAPAPTSGSGPDYRGQRGPAAIRYNNPGAMWPGPSSRKFGAVDSITLNDGQGNKIAVFPDAVHGAAAQFDLLERKYTGKTLATAIRTWSGGNSSEAYAVKVAAETGLTPATVLTSDMIRDPRIAIPIARSMASMEAGRKAYPLEDGQWAQAHQMAFGAGAPAAAAPAVPKPTQVADAGGAVAPANDNAGQPSAGGEAPDPGSERADPNEPPTAQAASDVQAPGASVAGTQKPTEFGNTQIPMGRLAPGQVFTVKTPQGEMKIPSEWINALPQRAREQMSKQAGEQYKLYERQLKATADEQMKNQEISVANTGKNAVDYDPATVKLAYQKDPKKLIEHARRVRIASEMHSELADAVSLPDDEIVARVERLRPQEGAPDFAERQAVFEGAEKRVLALMKQRETDPGKAVEGAKEVQSVRSKLVGGVPRNKLDSLALMDARMAAQRNIDIPEHLRSPITGDEARALAAPLRGLNPGDALESIQKLHDKVKGQYGEKYSGLIIDRVIATTIREKQKRESFSAMLKELDEEGKVSPTSVERMRNLEELGRREREIAPTRAVKPPAPGIMSRLYDMLPSKEAVGKAIRGDHDYNADNALNGTGPDRPAEPVKVYPTPNADHIARLKKFPQSIDQFDQVFGDGAAEKAVPGVRRMLKLQGVQ